MIGRGDGVLRTIKSTTKTILGNDFNKCIDFTEYWEYNGQALLQLIMRENFEALTGNEKGDANDW